MIMKEIKILFVTIGVLASIVAVVGQVIGLITSSLPTFKFAAIILIVGLASLAVAYWADED